MPLVRLIGPASWILEAVSAIARPYPSSAWAKDISIYIYIYMFGLGPVFYG